MAKQYKSIIQDGYPALMGFFVAGEPGAAWLGRAEVLKDEEMTTAEIEWKVTARSAPPPCGPALLLVPFVRSRDLAS